MTYSPNPRNKLLTNPLIQSGFIPISQPLNPYHQSIQFSPMPTRNIVYASQNLMLTDREAYSGRKRSNSQSNIDHLTGIASHSQYFKSLENKIRLVIEENDKLVKALDDKNIELQGFQQLESKVKLLLEENTHLNQLLRESGKLLEKNRDIPLQNPEETNGMHEDIMNKMGFLMQENEKLEGLLDNLQENFKKEMESYQQETEGKIITLMKENERLVDIANKEAEVTEKLPQLLEENDKLTNIINEKNDTLAEINAVKTQLEEILLDSEARIRILCQENEQLNDVLAHNLQAESSLEPKIQTILGKNSELLQIINEKNVHINGIQQQNFRLKQIKTDEKTNLNEYEFQVDAIVSEYEQLKLKYSDLFDENSRILQENKELKANKEKYKAEEEGEFKNLHEKMTMMNQEFSEQLNEKIELSFSLRERCNLLLEQNEKLQNVIKDNNQKIMEMKKLWENVAEELDDSQIENYELKERILKFKEEFEEFKKFIRLDEKRSEFLNSYDFKNMNFELRKFTERCSILEEEKELAWIENEKLKDQFKNNNRIMSKEKIDIETAYNQLNQFKIENDFLSHKIIDFEENQIKFENEINILNTQIVQWKNMNEHNKNEINKLYNILKTRKNENQNLMKRNEEMQKEMNRLTKNNTEMLSENFILREKVALLENELEKVSIKRNGLEEVSNGLQENVEKFKGEVEEKIQDLESLRKEYNVFVSKATEN